MYYHVHIYQKHNYHEFKTNLNEEELESRIVKPYQEGEPIVINGKTIQLNLIVRIQIFQTPSVLDEIVKRFQKEYDQDTRTYKMFGSSPTVKAMETGVDVSDKFITGAAGHKPKIPVSTLETDNHQKKSIEKVFIVHGHDNALKDEISVFLKGIGLDPIVLHRQVDGGLTVIEKFEKYSDVSYAFVLLTPDDFGFPVSELQKPEQERKGEFRARQNVIFELGFFIGKLTRSHVCCLYKQVEVPSDISGLIYKKIETSIDAVGLDIIKELKNAGLNPTISF